MLFKKDEIVDSAIRSILIKLPSLLKFSEQGKLRDHFSCFLDHLEMIFQGKELTAEDWDRCNRLVKDLGATALSIRIPVEDLISATFIFRQIFWKEMEKSETAKRIDPQKLLETVRKMNEYLAQLNFELMHR